MAPAFLLTPLGGAVALALAGMALGTGGAARAQAEQPPKGMDTYLVGIEKR